MSCPICAKDSVPAYRPFCSRRCADLDLGRWLTGGYAIPGEALEDGGEALRDDPEDPQDKGPARH